VIRQSASLAVAIGLALRALSIAPAGAATLNLAAGATPAVKRLAVSPSVGGLTTVVHVGTFVVDAGDVAGITDSMELIGPTGTSCAGELVSDNIYGPNPDGSGPVTLYIGPRAAWAYPEANYTYDPSRPTTENPLSRWCPGTYTGEIWNPDPYLPSLKATFQFRIAATTRTKLSTTGARHLRAVTVTPGTGGRSTAFAVHYRADSDPSDNGDVVQLIGPRRTSCGGTVVRRGAARFNGRGGQLTLHIGPGAARNHRWYEQGAAYVPASNDGTGRPFRNWCAGTYDGTIFYEQGPRFTVIARFKLKVAR
jgi:hypothetical protein